MSKLVIDDLSGQLRWRDHPDRVSSIKNMSKSELSRRRLKVNTSEVVEEAPPAADGAEEMENSEDDQEPDQDPSEPDASESESGES